MCECCYTYGHLFNKRSLLSVIGGHQAVTNPDWPKDASEESSSAVRVEVSKGENGESFQAFCSRSSVPHPVVACGQTRFYVFCVCGPVCFRGAASECF